MLARRPILAWLIILGMLLLPMLGYGWMLRRGYMDLWADSTKGFAVALDRAAQEEPLPPDAWEYLSSRGLAPENIDAFAVLRFVPAETGIECAYFGWPIESPSRVFVAEPDGDSRWLKGKQMREFLDRAGPRSRPLHPSPLDEPAHMGVEPSGGQ